MFKKPLHLIIDSGDKVGKTTVCKILSERLKIRTIKMQNMIKYFDDNPEIASQAFNESLCNFKDISFIMDRGYPSSLVYSAHFRRQYDFSYLKEWCKEMKPKIFILVGQPRKPDDIISEDDQLLISGSYADRTVGLDEYGIKWNRVYVDGKKPEEIASEIIRKLK